MSEENAQENVEVDAVEEVVESQEEAVESVTAEATEVDEPQQSPQAPPQNYLVMAILATIFCCWPLGIPAIIFAAQVNTKFTQGDYAGAEAASGKAKLWSIISICGGLVGVVLYAVLMVFGLLAGANG